MVGNGREIGRKDVNLDVIWDSDIPGSGPDIASQSRSRANGFLLCRHFVDGQTVRCFAIQALGVNESFLHATPSSAKGGYCLKPNLHTLEFPFSSRRAAL